MVRKYPKRISRNSKSIDRWLLADMFTNHSRIMLGIIVLFRLWIPNGHSNVPATSNMLSSVTDWGRGWEISGGDLKPYANANTNDGFKIRRTDPRVYTEMTLDSGAKGYGSGGGGSRSGAGSGNSDSKGASNGVLEGGTNRTRCKTSSSSI